MPVLTSLRPSAAVHGGRVTLLGTDLPIPSDGPPDVTIGGVKSRVVFASRRAIEVLVPADAAGGRLPVQVADVPEGALALAPRLLLSVDISAPLRNVSARPRLTRVGELPAAFDGHLELRLSPIAHRTTE